MAVVVGEACPEWLPDHDYLIYENCFTPGPHCKPDLILPSALFTEGPGTMISVDGRLRTMGRAVEPPDQARPDWWIMGAMADAIAQRTGRANRMAYEDVSKVQEDLRKRLRALPGAEKRPPFSASGHRAIGAPQEAAPGRPKRGEGDGHNPYLLYCKAELETYRGLPLSDAVAGMRQIGNWGHLLFNPDDAARLGLREGNTAEVGSDGLKLRFPVRTSLAVGEGVLLLVTAEKPPFGANPCYVDVKEHP